MSWHWYHLNSRRSIRLIQRLGHHLQELSNTSSRFLSRGDDERTRLAALIDARYLHQRARSPDIAAGAHDFHVSTVNVELRVDLIGEDMLEAQEVMSGWRRFGNREVVLVDNASCWLANGLSDGRRGYHRQLL